MIFIGITGIMLLLAFWTDVSRQKIPNSLTAGGWLLGMLLHPFMTGWNGLADAFLGTAIGLLPMFVLYLFRAVGAGDVKLFAALGALNGSTFVMQSLVYSLWYAAVAAVIILLWRREWKTSFTRMYHVILCLLTLKSPKHWLHYADSNHHIRFPMMWAVLPAAVTVYLSAVSI